MREPKDVQAELDAAQVGLQDKVGQLKDLVEDKLETPKQVAHAIAVPFRFARHHAVLVGLAIAGLVVLRRRRRARLRARRRARR